MASTTIEWTEATWNPVTGCTRASSGCDLCYAVTLTRRLAAMGLEKYVGLINPNKRHFNGVVRVHPDTLDQPLKRRADTLWFVNSMSDLFHKDVPFEFIAAVFGVMAATPQHQYQILTKRPAIMGEFFDWVLSQSESPVAVCTKHAERTMGVQLPVTDNDADWPLPNIWLGTSVEDERVLDRVAALQSVPAQVRFISCEPLIGPVDLKARLDGIHWVIVGGESGHGARPMEPAWAGAIQDACHEQDVAYFFKQTGAVLAKEWGLTSRKGSDRDEWPSEYQRLGERALPA